jgi:hypothetical protein
LEYNHIDQINEPSEGEIFLTEFLNYEGISFQTEIRLPSLTDDKKSYRVADFYLPNYKIYIEFFGRWNTSEEDRNKYREKMRVYRLNEIPCIFIYPENLGIIHYSFNYRLRQELRKHNLNKELFRYNLKLLLENRGGSFFWLALSIFLLVIFQSDKKAEWYWQSCLVVGIIAIYQLWRIIAGYNKYFRKEYSYVNFMRE